MEWTPSFHLQNVAGKTSASAFVIRDLRAGNEYISFKKRYTAGALGSITYATVMNTQSKNKMRQAVTMLLGTFHSFDCGFDYSFD